MKKKAANLSPLTKMILLSLLIEVIINIVFLIVGLTTSFYGWLYGGLIGAFVEIICLFLLYKGSQLALDKLKSWIFLLFYFSRMLIYLLTFIGLAYLQFALARLEEPILAFNYAFWGGLIAISPAQIIVIIVMLKEKKSPLTISEINPENKEGENNE